MPLRLGHKLSLVLLLLMLGVALATATLVYFGFQRTQDNARESSQAGLEEIGLRLIVEMARSQSDSGVSQLEQAARLSEEMSRYFVNSLPSDESPPFDPSQLTRGTDGQFFDANPMRRSDLFLPNNVQLSDAVLADIRDSASLDALFASLLTDSGEPDGQSFNAVALFYHSTQHVIRYYPPVGLADILPPDLRIEVDLLRAGPEQNFERRTVWSDPYEDEAGQGFLITAMTPIFVGDTYRGRIGVDVSMDWLAGQIASVQPTPNGFAFYVDRNGDLLESGGGGILVRNLGNSDGLKRMFEAMGRDENGATRLTLDGQEFFIAYSGFGSVGGSFGVAAPIAEITADAAALSASINEQGSRTIIVVLAAMAGLFVIALIGAGVMNQQILLRPIQSLVEGTKAVAQGDFDVAIETRGRDEMAQLGHFFNLMTLEVRQQRDSLQAEVVQRQAAQEELQALFAAMTDVVLVLDRDGRYIQVPSTGAPGFLQASRGLLGKTMHEVMPNEAADFFLERLQNSIDSGHTLTFEYPMQVEGRTYWFSAAVSPMASSTAVVVQRDITTIKEIENDLRAWQQRHLAMVNSVDAVLWEAPADFSRFTFVSEQAERLLGYPIGRWLNEPSFWADHIHPDDRDWCVNFCEMKTAAGEDHDFEYRMVASDGRTIWLRDIVSVVMEDGKPSALRGVMVDITSLKTAFGQLAEREEQYRAVFESATDGIVITDGDTGLLVAANPAFCRMHGYKDMVGMEPQQFIHPGSHHLFEQFRVELLKGNDFRCRAQDVRQDGSTFDVDVIGRGFIYQERFALLGVVRDVTEEVRAFQLLEERVSDRTREIERRRAVAEGLRDLLTVVNSSRSLDDILHVVVEQARTLLQSDASSILLPDESGHYLVTRARSGRGDQDLFARLQVEGSAVGVAFSRCRPTSVPDVAGVYDTSNLIPGGSQSAPVIEEMESHLRVTYLPLPADPDQADRVHQLGRKYRGFLAVPLSSSEHSYGALSLNFLEPREFTEEEIALAMAFADQATLALENARLSEQVQAAAAYDERQRLARELHDAVTQTLFSTSLIAEVMPDLWERSPELARQKLEDLRRLTRGALAEMRTLLIELRPAALTELSLSELLRQLAEATAGKTKLQVPVEMIGQLSAPLPAEIQMTLYRIAQEALNNVIRHAQASKVILSLDASAGGVVLQVQDDGMGFNPEEIPGGHLGVSIMKERAEAIGANLYVDSAPGKGTRILVRWINAHGDKDGQD